MGCDGRVTYLSLICHRNTPPGRGVAIAYDGGYYIRLLEGIERLGERDYVSIHEDPNCRRQIDNYHSMDRCMHRFSGG